MTHRPIEVALEVSALLSPIRTGIQVYTANLLRTLNDHPHEVSVRSFYRAKPLRKVNQSVAGIPVSRPYFHPLTANTGDAQITHSTDSKFLYRRQCANIATIHDVAIFLPEHEISGYTTPEFRSGQFARYSQMMKKADVMITVSESTKSDIVKLFSIDPDRIRVVYPGIESPVNATPIATERSALEHFGLQPKEFLLFVGTISIRKNLLNVIEAFGRSRLKSTLKLVLAGPFSMGGDEIIERVRSLGLERSVVFTSYVSDDELAELYLNAKAFVFPTYYEGFGMPILEAMSVGLPVLVGNRGAAPEIAGGLAIEVDPFSLEEIEGGLLRVVESDFDRSQLTAHAEKFTWDRCGQDIIGIYRELTD